MGPLIRALCFLLGPYPFVLKLNDNSATKKMIHLFAFYQENLKIFYCRFTVSCAKALSASATIHNQSSLHMALWRGHEKSAFALVRAGADIWAPSGRSLRRH
jgi:hypothetical protein